MEPNLAKTPRDYRFSLRTLLIVLAVAPPLLWGAWLALWLLVAARPRASWESGIVLLAWVVALCVAIPPLRRAIRRL